jgi:hypothetical protein
MSRHAAFLGWLPGQSRLEKLYDNLDFQRAAQACPLALPTVNQLASHVVLGDFRVGDAIAEEFPDRIHHRATTCLSGRRQENQSNEVASFWSAELNGRFNSISAKILRPARPSFVSLSPQMRTQILTTGSTAFVEPVFRQG